MANRYYWKIISNLKLIFVLSFYSEKRYDIDLVHDNVQKELIKEIEIEQGALSLLQRLLEQVNEQLRLNRKVKYDLDCDLKDKFSAQSIDEYAKEIQLTNPDLYLKSGAAKIESQ